MGGPFEEHEEDDPWRTDPDLMWKRFQKFRDRRSRETQAFPEDYGSPVARALRTK